MNVQDIPFRSDTQKQGGVGGLFEIEARGPQDGYTYDSGSDNPFTRKSWFRGTPCGLEYIEEEIELKLGSINKYVIPRRGDMVGSIHLEIDLPDITAATINDLWVDDTAYILLKHVRLLLNDTELDSQERLFYDIYDRMILNKNTRSAIQRLTGNAQRDKRMTVPYTLIVPLKFFTTKRQDERQTFLPIVGTPGTELYVEIETETFANMVRLTGGKSPALLDPGYFTGRFLIEYAFLNEEERVLSINRPIQILADVVQDAEGFSFRESLSMEDGDSLVATDVIEVDMAEVSFPVKYLAFVLYTMNDVSNKNYFSYIQDMVESVSLRMDNNERESNISPGLYSVMHPHQFAARLSPKTSPIYFYSFCLNPDTSQPTGHYNFANVHHPKLRIQLKEKRDDVVCKVFIVGTRFIQFLNGRAQTTFA